MTRPRLLKPHKTRGLASFWPARSSAQQMLRHKHGAQHITIDPVVVEAQFLGVQQLCQTYGLVN
eukprot:gene8221-7560_t